MQLIGNQTVEELHQNPGQGTYSETCLKQSLKNRQNKILMTSGSLMKVESIAECSHWSILHYFWPALSNNWSWNPIFVFLRVVISDRFHCTLI